MNKAPARGKFLDDWQRGKVKEDEETDFDHILSLYKIIQIDIMSQLCSNLILFQLLFNLTSNPKKRISSLHFQVIHFNTGILLFQLNLLLLEICIKNLKCRNSLLFV